jgi:hypothetical protein
MVGKNIGVIKGPQNNFGNGALKVGRLGQNLFYKSIRVNESGVVDKTDDNNLHINDRIIQLENIEISGEILLDSSSIGLIESNLTENYGDGVVSLSRVLFDIIKDSRDTDADQDSKLVLAQAAITAEATTARAAESANEAAITAEATTARAAESANEAAITAEAATARAAESANEAAIDDIKNGNTEFTGMPQFTNGFYIGEPEGQALIKMIGEVKALTVDTTQLNIKDSVLTMAANTVNESEPLNQENDNVPCDYVAGRRYYGMRVKIGNDPVKETEKYKARQLSYDSVACKWTTGLVNASGTGDFGGGTDLNFTDFTGIQLSHVEFSDPRVASKHSQEKHPTDWLLRDDDVTIREILNAPETWTELSDDIPTQAKPGNYKIQIIMHYTEKIKLCRVGDNFVLEVALKSSGEHPNAVVDKETSMVKLSDLHPVIFRMIDLA